MTPDDTVSLKEFILRIFDEWRHELDARFQAQQESLVKDSVNNERRLAALNELREDVTKDRVLYLTRAEYDAKHEALEQLVNSIAENARIERENMANGLDSRLRVLESWRFRASGIFLVLVPLAGLIGAAIIKAFGG